MSHRSPPTVFEVWSETSARMFEGAMRANRAAIEAFGATANGASGDGDAADADAEERIAPAEDLPGWETESEVEDQPTVGGVVRFSKALSEDDVDRFAAASGDTNPIHLDDQWADETRFEGRIVHGTLAAGLISAALARFPGSVIYLSQDLEFHAPVRLGDRVTAEVTIVEALGDDRFRLRTTVEREDTRIIDGEAVVLIDDPPA
jgi:acyl dehydratase